MTKPTDYKAEANKFLEAHHGTHSLPALAALLERLCGEARREWAKKLLATQNTAEILNQIHLAAESEAKP